MSELIIIQESSVAAARLGQVHVFETHGSGPEGLGPEWSGPIWLDVGGLSMGRGSECWGTEV